jgi:5,5'-dehydrodivanillate O-demethylase
MNQDFVTWVGQGRIADRTREHLAHSDRGIVLMRRRFLSDMDAIEAGKDPKAIVRDPAVNECIALPVAERKVLIDGLSRDALMRDPFHSRSLQGYILQTGQPPEVRQAFLAAMGVNDTDIAGPEVALDPLAPSKTPR